MTARITAAIDGYTWTEQDDASLRLVLENTDSVSTLVRNIDGGLALEALRRAGQRLWSGSLQPARLAMGDSPKRHDDPNGQVIAIGFSNGPVGRTDRVIRGIDTVGVYA